MSLAHPLGIDPGGEPERWSYPITTMIRWEGGIEETTQGEAHVIAWAAHHGFARLAWRIA